MKVKSILKVFPKDTMNMHTCHFLLYDKDPVVKLYAPFGPALCNSRNTNFKLEDYSIKNITMKFTKKMYYDN